MWKRITALLMVLSMLCTGAALAEDTTPAWPTLADRTKCETKIEKITDEPVTITIWIDFAPTDISNMIEDFQSLDLLTTLKEKTGATVELVCAPVGEGATNFSLLLASGKMPDIILGFDSFYAKGGDAAIDEGIIIDLKDLVEQYAPHYNAARTASVYRSRATVTDTGRMPYFCQMTFNDEQPMTYGGPIIRQDVLDKLGMTRPATFDDWHTFLTRAKSELNMTRPLGFSYNGISKYNAFNSAFGFGASDAAQGGDFCVVDNKVMYGAMSEGYKSYLQLMNQWYQDGLIDPDFTSTISFDDGIAMLSGDLCAGSSDHSGVLGYINMLGQATNPDFNFVAAPYPVFNIGDQLHYGYIKSGSPLINAAAVTTSCQHPEIAVKLIDQLYTDEGFLLCNFGTEGKTYDVVDGVPVFNELIANNEQGTAAHMLALYAASAHWPFEYVLGHADAAGLDVSATVWDANNDYAWSFPSSVTLTTEEKDVYSKHFTDITTYVEEMTVKYIMGLESFDNYDSFTATLEELGIHDVLAAYQSAYDRYLSR